MYGYIYKITCLINNKCYVGSKKASIFVEKYWSSSKNNEFWKDINIYGKENFKREILCWCETVEEAREKEKKYIISEKALITEGGYNLALGAHAICFSKEVVNKMQIKAKNRWKNMTEEEMLAYREKRRKIALDPNGTMQSKEYKEKMRKAISGRRVYTNGIVDIHIRGECPEGFIPGSCKKGLYNIKWSEEHRKNASKVRLNKYVNNHWWNNGKIQKFCKDCPGEDFVRGRLNAHWNKNRVKKKYKCIENGLIFETTTLAAKWLNILDIPFETVKCNIARCCNKKFEMIYGYHWEYVKCV